MPPSLVSRALAAAGALVAPPRCAGCGVLLHGRELFCDECAVQVDGPVVESAHGLSLVAIGRHDGVLARSVRLLKYEGRPDLARPLAAALSSAMSAAGMTEPAVLVPVPLHPVRLAERGYNQSALLASALGKVRGWRVEARGLARTRLTLQQAALDRALRVENAQDAFAVRTRVGGRVVLVDDVVTTMATALACRAALTGAGADVVAVVAAARRGTS